MGLQPWVKGSPTSPSGVPVTVPSSQHSKKKRKYDDIKNLIRAGKVNEVKGAVRDGDWDFNDDIRTRLWPLLDSIHESMHPTGDYWETVKDIFGHERNGKKLQSISRSHILRPVEGTADLSPGGKFALPSILTHGELKVSPGELKVPPRELKVPRRELKVPPRDLKVPHKELKVPHRELKDLPGRQICSTIKSATRVANLTPKNV